MFRVRKHDMLGHLDAKVQAIHFITVLRKAKNLRM